MNTTLSALIAGVAFGFWPLLMNRSGLGGVAVPLLVSSTTMIISGCLVFFNGLGSLEKTDWRIALFAAVLGSSGMAIFCKMTMNAKPEQIGLLYVVVCLAQICVPVLWHLMSAGQIDATKAVGLACAVISVILLLK